MRILVTGYKGFIGSKIYDSLKNINDKNINVYGLEISEPFPEVKYDIIYHFGGKTLLRESLKEPHEYFEQNVNFTAKLLEKARKDDSIFIFPTTGSSKAENPYSISKAISELWIKMYSDLYGIKGALYRLYNVYGGKKGAVYLFLKSAVEGNAITLYNRGENLRDYIYVDDVVNYILHDKHNEKIMVKHVGTGIGTSTLQLVHKIEDFIGHKVEIRYGKSDVKESFYSIASDPVPYSTSLEKGIEKVYDLIKNDT